jgi:transcription antitermination factor NusA-like protein
MVAHRNLCEVCIRSEILCPACEKKFREGIIDDVDVKVTRFLEKLKDRHRQLRDCLIEKVLEGEGQILIIVRKGDGPKVIGKGGTVVRALMKEFNKQVKIVERESNLKDFAAKLVRPGVLQALSIVYAPDGSEKIKVVVKGLRTEKELVERAIKYIYGKDAEVIY